MQNVEEGNSLLPLSDKSPAEVIEMHFGVSKCTIKYTFVLPGIN
jgi:predicted RNA-binding protein (virulence factor B family)